GSSGTAEDILTVDPGLPGFSKSFAPSTVEIGGRSTLTFTIDNSANGAFATFVTFTDTLPVGMVVADPANASTGCDFSSSPVLTAVSGADGISLLTAGVAAEDSCTVAVDVVGGVVGSLGNVTGELFSTISFVPNSSAGKAAAVLEVTGFTDLLELAKEFIDDPVAPGGTVTLEFTVTNKSRVDSATAITFSDDLETTLTGLTATLPPTPDPPCGAGSSLAFGPGLLTLTGGNLPPEGSCRFSVELAVPGGATPGTYPNTAGPVSGLVGGSPETGNTASDLLFVVSFPVLTKEFTDDPVGAGDDVTLEFTITNPEAGSTMSDIAFMDELTTFLPFPVSVALPPTPDPPCGAGSSLALVVFGNLQQAISLTGGSLAAGDGSGDSCTFSVMVTIPVGFPAGTFTNTTDEITAVLDDFAGPPTVIGPGASDDLVVVGAPNLTKQFTDDPVLPGGTVTLQFTLRHEESALADATSIGFTDDLAAALTDLTATGLPLADLCGTGNGTMTGTVSDTFLTVAGITLAPAEECTFSVTLAVPGMAVPGFHTNTTSDVTTTVSGVTATGNPGTDDLLVTGLTLTKEFTDDPVIAGGTVTLKFTLDNASPTDDADTIFFSDNLDATLTGLAPSGALPTMPCGPTSTLTFVGTTLTLTAGEVPADDMCMYSVTLLVPGSTPDGSYPNATSMISAIIDATALLLPPATDTLIVNSTLLEITKEFTDDPVPPGGTVTLEFTLTNLSATETVTDIAFDDDLDAALSGLEASAETFNGCGGTATSIFPTGLFEYAGGMLLPGASCTITLTVDVPDAPLASGPPFVNTTTGVTGKVGALDVVGDPASDELIAQLLTLTKSFDGPTTATGTAVLTFTIENLDSVNAVSGLAFSDDLDAVLSGLVATVLPVGPVCDTGSVAGTSFLTLSSASLDPGGMCSFDVTVTVPATGTAGTFLNTTSDLFQFGIPVADPASALLTIEPPPTFAKAFLPDAIGQGFVTTLIFTIDNTASALAASGLTFLDTLPFDLVVAAVPAVVNTCGGAVVAAPSSATISLAGGMVAAGVSCTISVQVFAPSDGVFVNETGDLTSSSGNSGTATDTLTVAACTAADGANLTLENDVVLSPEFHEVCNTIEVKQHFLVLGPDGELGLVAGVAVIFFDGLEIGQGGEMEVEIDPSLIP
ncbi:MAG: hypothetical protein IH936_07225, partial [Acidobacteria bacterium]|nr:hypothetical protein [Acidobacteriota bacterium]